MGESGSDTGQGEENALNETELEIFEKLSQLDEQSAKRVLSKLSAESSYLGCIQWQCSVKIHAHG